MNRREKMGRVALISVAAATLAACQRESAPPALAPTEAASPVPANSKVSIIRPDVEVTREPAEAMRPLTVRVGFDDGATALSPSAVAVLERALASAQMKAGGRITLGGHSDSVGGDAANLAASRKRAEAVREWLVQHGISEDRMTVVAFGEQNPEAPNALENGEPHPAGRARNRRVELSIAVPPRAPAPEQSQDATLVDELTSDR
jgi:OOP family OmpA-OmpF porin